MASSIHAPSPDTFALFDRVLILQRGRAVYFGENGEVMRGHGPCLPVLLARARVGTLQPKRLGRSHLQTHSGRSVFHPRCSAGEACSRYFSEQFPALRPIRPWEGMADYMWVLVGVGCGLS